MVKLRLARFGAKKQPYYRIVAADAHGKRDGRFIELLGTYDPRKDPPAVTLKVERVQYWLSVGAAASDQVGRLLHFNMPKVETPKPVSTEPKRKAGDQPAVVKKAPAKPKAAKKAEPTEKAEKAEKPVKAPKVPKTEKAEKAE